MFQYIHHNFGSAGGGGSGFGMGQGHPSWQFVSIWCLQLHVFTFVHFDILT